MCLFNSLFFFFFLQYHAIVPSHTYYYVVMRVCWWRKCKLAATFIVQTRKMDSKQAILIFLNSFTARELKITSSHIYVFQEWMPNITITFHLTVNKCLAYLHLDIKFSKSQTGHDFWVVILWTDTFSVHG